MLDLARSVGLPATGGSDAHSAPAVGRCATLFDGPIRTERDLIDAIKRGGIRPVDMTAAGCPRVMGI